MSGRQSRARRAAKVAIWMRVHTFKVETMRRAGLSSDVSRLRVSMHPTVRRQLPPRVRA